MTAKRKLKFTIYRDAKFEWRWHVQSNNGKILADSGESYDEKRGAKRSLKSLIDHIAGGNYEIEE